MMESPPSCSAWNGIAAQESRPPVIRSASLSSGIDYFESEDELRLYFDKPIIKDPWLEPPLEFQDTPPPWTRRALTPTPASFLSPGTSASSLSLSLLRTSSSHNSLSVPMAKRADDSSFITSAMSHDVLTDLYNVPIDSDIYTLPIDTIRPRSNHRKRHYRHNGKKRRRHTANPEFHENDQEPPAGCNNKRLSAPANPEPVHMTLQEVRQFLHTLYNGNQNDGRQPQSKRKHKKKAKTIADEKPVKELTNASTNNGNGTKTSLSHILKQTLCNMFRVKKQTTSCLSGVDDKENNNERLLMLGVPKMLPPLQERALPPLPDKTTTSIPTLITKESAIDFASSIEKVKDYGWYWGPISGEAAEKILSNEPDGSFIVRDSSDHHYIFSLTFRLNGCVRHVRIEHDQGNFSFGSSTKFKSQTIVEFIETAVEHSRSGRYLFFLHRRPVLGPMRVQLLHPVSRFKHVQSLQHLCRFAIVKVVRRDLIPTLPLPRRLIDYLSAPQYYSEQLSDQEQPSPPPSLHVFSFATPTPRTPTSVLFN
ncbi:suppressor of cytokine signaling [Nesidiocoris tenuis]|nr:suppressor of cytokine signaling [Nesidiocoris tenuis]